MERLLSLNLLLASLLTGLVAGSAVAELPAGNFLIVLGLLSLLLLLLYICWRRPLLLYGAACLGGLWVAFCQGQQLYGKRLPEVLAGSDWGVEVVVSGLPERTPQGERFDVQVERVLQAPAAAAGISYPFKLRLAFYPEAGRALTPQGFYFQPGQRWRLQLRLKPPRGFVNANSFDYEGWLLQQGYHATGYVRDLWRAERLPDALCEARLAAVPVCVDKLAFFILQWIDQQVPPQHRALFAALTIGYGADFDRAQWDVLRNTGTIHLVVVSGFHIGMMAWLGYGLFALLARLLLLPLWAVPAPRCGALGAALFAICYAFISGFTLPVQRALVMVLCGLSIWSLRTRIPLSTACWLACLLVLLLDPLAIFSISFWLSFGAVTILFYVFANRVGKSSWYYLWFKIQCCISIGMVPLLAHWIGSVPVNTPLANLFAVPYITFIVLPLLILVLVFSGSSAVLAACNSSMDFFWYLLRQFEKINYTVYFSSPDNGLLVVTIFAMLGVMVMLAPRGIFHHRWMTLLLVIFLWMPLFYPPPKKIPPGEFVLTLLDVGQGLSVLVETANHVLVYDTGDKFSEQFDIGRDLLANQLQRKGYRRVDTLVISHGDSDHAGGMEGLLSVLPAGRILSGEPDLLERRLQNSTVPIHPGIELCQAGQHWRVDGVDFHVLSPAVSTLYRKSNNRSCVLRVSGLQHSLLLSGDIHSDQEQWLLAQVPARLLDSDVLLVPHHGSKSSSSAAFIDSVSPRIALVSVGYHSRYGHPHGPVVERYQQRAIRFLRTDQSGALVLSSVDHFQQVEQARWQSGRYWHRW